MTSETSIQVGGALQAILENPPPELSAEDLAKIRGMDLSSKVLKHVIETTVRLLEITAEQASLEYEHVASIFGSPQRSKTTKTFRAKSRGAPQEEQAWASKDEDEGASVAKIPFSAFSRPAPAIEGIEELELAERTVRCRSVEETLVHEGFSLWKKTWYSSEIPGGVARWETRAMEPSSHSSRMVVTSFEKR